MGELGHPGCRALFRGRDREVSFAGLVGFCHASRMALLWPCFLLAARAFMVSFLLGRNAFLGEFVLLVIAGAMRYAPYGHLISHIWPNDTSQCGGGAIALINSMGAL